MSPVKSFLHVLWSPVAGDFLDAIRHVSPGQIYLRPAISRTLSEAYRSKPELPKDSLTVRERQMLQLIAEAKSTKEIAVPLEITVKTAESHRTRLMQKLDIHENRNPGAVCPAAWVRP